jgi:hypothetical protein
VHKPLKEKIDKQMLLLMPLGPYSIDKAKQAVRGRRYPVVTQMGGDEDDGCVRCGAGPAGHRFPYLSSLYPEPVNALGFGLTGWQLTMTRTRRY